jgi:uncharacterized protein
VLTYLDSSAIVKRYIEEIGSESLDFLYTRLEREEGGSEHFLAFSSWNLGEVFGAIDTRCQRGDIDKKSMVEAMSLFSRETKKFVAMRKVNVLPIGSRVLTMSRDLVLKYHIYQADALQLASAKQVGTDLFVSADRKLIDCAKSELIDAASPERDYELIQNTVTKKKGEK